MLTYSFWLSSLLFIASATAHAYAPAGLRPRCLSITGTSVPFISTPPYPTGSANGTAIPTASTYVPTATSMTPPVSTPFLFYLVTAGTGTFLDGYYLYYDCCYGGVQGGTLAILRFTNNADVISRTSSTFSLNGNSTLKNTYGGVGRAFDDSTTLYWFFNNGDIYGVDQSAVVHESICEIVGGELTCVTGVDTVFLVCGIDSANTVVGNLVVQLGTAVPAGCSPFTLLVVPV